MYFVHPNDRETKDQLVAFLTIELTSSQIEDLLAVYMGVEVEIKALQGLSTVKCATANTPLELLLRSPFSLIFQDAGQELQAEA